MRGDIVVYLDEGFATMYMSAIYKERTPTSNEIVCLNT